MAIVVTFALVTFDKVRTATVSNATLAIGGVLFVMVLLRQYLFVADRSALAISLREAVDEQQRLAITDGLTGLYNRRHLTTRLGLLSVSPEHPASLLVIDLDHFKRINDTYGHPAGDAVLQETSTRLGAGSRDDDVVARYGGEEFVLLLPDTGQQQARALAERLLRRIRETPIAAGPDLITVTASIGVATSTDGDTSRLLEVADRALYQAKEQGRDQAVSATAAPPATFAR
jgi:diguanylate cyclase (GGDEF)-like protein